MSTGSTFDPNTTVLSKTKKAPTATLHLVQSSRTVRRFARILLIALGLTILAMAFLPWQQTSRGTGQVIAYVPQERQQSIQAPVKGIVATVTPGLYEGSEVKKDDLILVIEPFAVNLVEQLRQQLRELNNKLDSADLVVKAYEERVKGFTDAREFTVSAANQMVDSANAKLESKKKLVSAYEAKMRQAKLNYDRQADLLGSGIRSPKEVEKLDKDLEVAKAELESIHDEVTAVQKEVAAKKDEREEKRLLAQTKIDSANATLQDAIGKAATIRKDITDLEIKLAEMDRLEVRAPRDGTIFRMPVFERGQTIKEGDPVMTLVPEITQKAVELNVNGNDMPLVQVGQEVRLQFEGWPAVQFAGWPSVAVGTFSGTVVNVDATDNGKGQFRILITPNEEDSSWPSDRYLRQGVRVNGWVMLRQVSLGYEVWRQLNGFPVIVSDEEPTKKQSKVPKLPK